MNEPSSSRDHSSRLSWVDGQLQRTITGDSLADYDLVMNSGLYDALVKQGRLVAHTEVSRSVSKVVIQPELIPVVSYPYEWSFSQLKLAALTTLRIQRLALEHGMTLKDASAYNVQFSGYKPVLIDTGSFEAYTEGAPWVAYRQFCQHFLAPLTLMRYTDLDLGQLMRIYIDGIPLRLATSLLPFRSKIRPSLGLHLLAHGASQKRYAANHTQLTNRHVPRSSVLAIIDNLERTVRGMAIKRSETEWGEYYTFTNYNDVAFKDKAELVQRLCSLVKPSRVLDLGSNNGHFSRVLLESKSVDYALSADIDPLAVESNYQQAVKEKNRRILPLLLDLTNPSPALGWASQERKAFADRAQSDLVMALALVHHLAISNNVPLEMIAGYLRSLAPAAIVEFIPKTDSQVQLLLANRKDVFPDYTQAGFEESFSKHFKIREKVAVRDSERVIYLLVARD